MKCPRDKTDMIVVEHQKIELDYCHKCSGVWVDAGELELLASVLKSPEATVSYIRQLTPQQINAGEAHLKCPVCRRKMEKVCYGESRGVLIDRCPVGEGLWFDSGELQQVLKEFALTGTQEAKNLVSFLGNAFQATFPKG